MPAGVGAPQLATQLQVKDTHDVADTLTTSHSSDDSCKRGLLQYLGLSEKIPAYFVIHYIHTYAAATFSLPGLSTL